MEWIRVSAKTVAEAVTEAAIQLGTSSDNMEYQVIEKGSNGFFGIGAKKALIEARKIKSDEDIKKEIFGEIDQKKENRKEEKKEVKKEARKEPKKEAKKENREPKQPKEAPVKKEESAPKAEKISKPETKEAKEVKETKPEKKAAETNANKGYRRDFRNSQNNNIERQELPEDVLENAEDGEGKKNFRQKRDRRDNRKDGRREGKKERRNLPAEGEQEAVKTREKKHRPAAAADAAVETEKEEKAPKTPRVPADPEEAKRRAEEFLKEVFRTMGMNVEMSVSFEDDTLSVDISGEDMGLLIGKRGQTLDSLQYLTSLVVNKGNASYVRVKLDTEDYRSRRKATLESLAHNIAQKVKKTRRPVFLEPMNPYERRIIHSALQNDPYVTTHSEGEEPCRKVVVTLKKNADRYDRAGRYGRKNKNAAKEAAAETVTGDVTAEAITETAAEEITAPAAEIENAAAQTTEE